MVPLLSYYMMVTPEWDETPNPAARPGPPIFRPGPAQEQKSARDVLPRPGPARAKKFACPDGPKKTWIGRDGPDRAAWAGPSHSESPCFD